MSTASTGSPMRSAIAATWALLLGVGVLMLGDGLQGTLLAVRASLEAFSTITIGLIMSTFSVGFLGGSLYAPSIVERVGHIRVFAALACIASAAILIHAVFVHPMTWGALRFVSGFCLAGLFVVAESWLNDRATNETRGQLLSIYMVISYGGVAVGQLLLNLADPLGFGLFILTSVLISIAAVPLLLSAGPTPSIEALTPMNVKQLFRITPLGVVGAMVVGMAAAAFLLMGPVYANAIGFNLKEISLFIAAAMVGCLLLQWPIGYLSDRFDRRQVLTVVTLLAGVAAVVVALSELTTVMLMLIVGLFGGLSLPLYSLVIAHANDFLEPHEMVAASGGLVLASGIGAILGPFVSSLVMTEVGPGGLFWSLASIHVFLGLFAVYRMFRRPAKALTEQSICIPTAARACQIAVAEELTESTARLQYGTRPPA